MQNCDKIEDLYKAHSPRLHDKINESGEIRRISRKT